MTHQIIKLITIAALFAVLFFQHCGTRKELAWKEGKGYRWAELPVSTDIKVGFEKLSESTTNIDFVNSLDKEQIIGNRHLYDGSGLALGDIDNDGFCDIYFCRLDGPNVLYRNMGNWQFEDITQEAGVAYPDQFCKGALLADIDGDRDLDLLITVLDGPNACFLNDGKGNFTEVTKEAGLSPIMGRTGNTSMAVADIDGDGDLDLYMSCYKAKAYLDSDNIQFHPNGQVYSLRDFGEPDIVYLNDGHGHFDKVKLISDRFKKETGKIMPMPRAWTLTTRLQDMDDDGDPDIYSCSDFLTPDFIWTNNGKGYFEEIPNYAIRSTSLSAMTVDFSDIDRDGDLDFFVAEMMSRDHQKRKMQMNNMLLFDRDRVMLNARPQILRNTLFLNRGDGTYAEIANYSGLQASDWTWSAIFMDVDLDGYEDLLTSTGHAYDVQDSDTEQKISNQKIKDLNELRESIFEYPRLETPNYVFRNKGDLTFEEMGKEWGFDTKGISHGMALADLDNDGDLDVVINNYQSPAGVYRNLSTAPRVAVRLKGLSPNTQGIGAKITLNGGPVIQSKEVIGGGIYLSSSDPLVVFAAAKNNKPMVLTVRWRNGKQSIIDSVKSNRIYEIDESFSESSAPHLKKEVKPIFEDISKQLSNYHHERPFDDFYFQPLLPNRMSQLGPGLSWYDIDKDNDDDLIIPTGRDGQLAIFINDCNTTIDRFHNLKLENEAEQDQTTALAFSTINGNTSLLIGTSNYENTPQAPSAVRYTYKNGRLQEMEQFAVEPSTTGPLALGDYDNDGDLDLFIGGRMIPGKYPEPASSQLYYNINGKFKRDELNSEKLGQTGLVSGAVFSDIDNDGDADLILATEWGPVKVFQNESGTFTNATDRLGLNSYYGWWNGVTTGDFDEDGKLDILATNWGLNTKYCYDQDHPLKIYYADFDNNGIVDIIEAYFDPFMKMTVPIRGFEPISKSMTFVGDHINTFQQYGGSNIQEIFGPALQMADSVSANTLAHMVFLQRANRFEAHPLPVESQFSPAFYAGVADFDGDGHDDVFLSQNFFATQYETPRMDAGRGLWLQGDGTGQFTPVPGQISGIKIYGEQRGAALSDFNKDGRIDLAVSQNNAMTKLYKNVNGKPGLRVRLIGSGNNPTGVGAIARLIVEGKAIGPAKEIHAGSGYWSQNSPVLIFGIPETPEGIKIQWPGGSVTETKLPAGVREVAINTEGKIVSSVK